jgi:hypothetical protein
MAFHPATKEYIIAGTGYDSDISKRQKQQQQRDSSCTVMIGNLENDTATVETLNINVLLDPQVCMGGVVAVPGTGARVAHVMGTTVSETHKDSTTEPIDTILQPLFYNHNKKIIENADPIMLPQYTYPVASTQGYGVSVFVAFHEVLNGYSAFAGKLLYHRPASTGSTIKKTELEEFLKFMKGLTDPKHIQSRPKTTATRSPRTPQIMHIVDPLDKLSEQNNNSYTITLSADEPTGAATIAAMKFHKGKNWLIVGGSVHGTGVSFGNKTLGFNKDEDVLGDIQSWDGFVSFFHGDTGEVIDSDSQIRPFRIHSSANQDDLVHDICLDDRDGLYVVGAFEKGVFIHKYRLGSHTLLWTESIPGGDSLKALHCVVSPPQANPADEYNTSNILYIGGETKENLVNGFDLPTVDVFVRAYNTDSGALVWSKQLDTSKIYNEDRHDHIVHLEVHSDNPNTTVALVNSIHLASGMSDVVFFDLCRKSGSSRLDEHQEPPKTPAADPPNKKVDPSNVTINTATDAIGAGHRAIIMVACMVPVFLILTLAVCQWWMNQHQSSLSGDSSLKQGRVNTVNTSDPHLGDKDDGEEGFLDECEPPPTDSFQYFHEYSDVDQVVDYKEHQKEEGESCGMVDVEIQ